MDNRSQYRSLRAQVFLLTLIAILGLSVIAALAGMTILPGKPQGGDGAFFYRQTPPGILASPDRVIVTPSHDGNDPDTTMVWIGSAFGVLYAVCVVAASYAISTMTVRPLNILEIAINSVDPSQVVPKLLESGSVEHRETVKLINQLSEKIKAMLDGKMRLVAAAGHDMRTPLTRMRLRVEMLQDDTTREKLLANIDEMTNIADSAILLVQESSRTAKLERLNLTELIEQTVDDLKMVGHSIDGFVTPDLHVVGNATSLKRAITNLANNACIYGEHAFVTLSSSSGKAVLEINDQGPGIPEDQMQMAFEPFFRVGHSRKKLNPGAGLGLAIAKEVLDHHGGTIKLENAVPNGLKQTVHLDLVA